MWQSDGWCRATRPPCVFRRGCVVLSATPTVRLPSQGPAPPKYIRGFRHWSGCFDGDCQVELTSHDCLPSSEVRATERSLWWARLPVWVGSNPAVDDGSHLQNICTDRTPRVSSEPEWAARKETHPARGTPCATGPDSHRGTGASGGRVVKATPRRLESVPPGALGGCFVVQPERPTKNRK